MKTEASKISALLITFNEIEHIEAVLENLSFADEIIVVDSYSTDGTAEIAARTKGVKFIQRPFTSFTDQKSFALEQASHPWILFTDADERIPENLRKEIINTVQETKPSASAYYFRRTFMFKDQVLRFSGWQSDKNFRLWQKKYCHFDPERIVHETLIVEGSNEVLQNKLIHYSYSSYADYKAKMVKYGQMKAREEFERGKRFLWPARWLRPWYKFFNHYILRLGILDGKKGVIISYLNALGVHARYQELIRLRREGD